MSLLSKKVQKTIEKKIDPEHLSKSVVLLVPPFLPFPCFPDTIELLLKKILPEEWNQISERARNYLRWISAKAESIDALVPKSPESPTKGFELLAIDRFGNSFGKIIQQCQDMEIPSVLIRFASLIATFLTIRLLRRQSAIDNMEIPSLMFTQNVDADYLNYPLALRTLLEFFPEYRKMFYFEVSEHLTTEYISTIRTLSSDLDIRLALDDSNKMSLEVHQQLLDLADWIKIDFQATAMLEKHLQKGLGDKIIWHYEYYAEGSQSPVIIFEGLSETSPLKSFLEDHWKLTQTSIYYQSRERLPIPPWNRYFGMIQDYIPGEFGLFFKGMLAE